MWVLQVFRVLACVLQVFRVSVWVSISVGVSTFVREISWDLV